MLTPLSAERSQREPMVAGTIVAGFALATGRWGSYLGHSPIFLTDILVAFACIDLVRKRAYGGLGSRVAPHRGLMILLLVWIVLRFIAGRTISLTALRDFLPYLYVVLGLIAGASLVQSTPGQRERTARLLVAALGFHLAWVFVSEVVMPTLPGRLPTLSSVQGVHVFSIRGDFDVSVVGAFAAYLLWRAFHEGWTARIVVGLTASFITIGLSSERSPILGAAVPIIVVLLASLRHVRIPYQSRMALVGCAAIGVAVVGLVLPTTVGGQRLLATVGAANVSGHAGVGTTSARTRAWKKLEHYDFASAERSAFGVGFGPDFMSNSGALVQLVGAASNSATDPRSPHSWWIGTQSRLGLIGLALVIALFGAAMTRAVRLPRSSAQVEPGESLIVVVSLVLLALVIPLSVGVIMESPFGAVPAFWAIGIVLNWKLRPLRAGEVANA